jgi:DNA-binding GntR family transcriptional regulator
VNRQIKHLPRSTFRDHIAEQLRDLILNGVLRPGEPLLEVQLAEQFGVSRGPLREAMRELVDEGLLVVRPYAGTTVVELSAKDIREIYSIRTALETLAFEQAWDRRDAAFHAELDRRHGQLIAAIDAEDEVGSIHAELDLHSLVFETADNKLLSRMWSILRGRLQIYWVTHHEAHGRRGPYRDAHLIYVESAKGDDVGRMISELKRHMRRGADRTAQFVGQHVRLQG